MIILATQGTGKSFAANLLPSTVTDIDRIRNKESLNDYVDRLISANTDPKTGFAYGEERLVFGNARLDIAKELVKRDIRFIILAPFKDMLAPEDYQEMKERIFGRLVLRKEQNERTVKYIEDLKSGYDEWTSFSYYQNNIEDPNGCMRFKPLMPAFNNIVSWLASNPML